MMFIKKRKNVFSDDPKTAVFTCCHVLECGCPILYVKHDADGDWQFLCGGEHKIEDARVVALEEMIGIDSDLSTLPALNPGESAVRDSKDGVWIVL